MIAARSKTKSFGSILCSRSRAITSSTKGSKNFRHDATMKWVDTIVIDQKLCPFAPPIKEAPHLRIKVSEATSHDEIINEIEREAHLLVGPSSLLERPKTTLVVLDEDKCPSLLDFRDLVRLSWRVQEEAINKHSFTELLQQVLFHPEASHDTYAERSEDDAADYTIRSPFPIIHLLREEDVMNAVTSGYPDLEGLPSRNKKRLKLDGIEVCARRLDACKDL
mmetsp:Transcript_27852/g.41301  ORF Transcript_27852/g.41301 Transcript_27852/m.41301 type:complete len:222 (+) Transcript_27852:125-790(+)